MKLALLPSALLALLASCGPNKHMNAWERQSSALDPVGITSKKMAAKHRADQASYKPGESVTFKKEKLMVFEQNPENNFSTSGTVKGGVKTAKVLVCGDLFAKVEFEDGSQGYVSLSEVVNPQEMMGFYPVTAPDMAGPVAIWLLDLSPIYVILAGAPGGIPWGIAQTPKPAPVHPPAPRQEGRRQPGSRSGFP